MPPRKPRKPSLEDRVAVVRAKLVRANTRSATWLAISGADREVLRVLENMYFHRPGPLGGLVDRIITGHLNAVAVLGGGSTTTQGVHPDYVAFWAMEAVADYLPGMTDFHLERGGQFCVSLDDTEEAGCSERVFTVTTVLGLDPRRFRVSVTVTEVS